MGFEITSLKAAYEPYHSRKGEPYRSANKLYIWPEGETVMENLFNRRNRPSRAWKQTLIPAIMAKLSKENPEIFERVKGEKVHFFFFYLKWLLSNLNTKIGKFL
jgi:hypothetical protein